MSTDQQSRQSFPLSSLFVLLSACAVVSALLTPVARAVAAGNLGLFETAVSSAAGALLMAIIGVVVGLHHYRPLRGIGWGILTGGTLGLLTGPLVLTPEDSLATLMGVSIGGAVVLLLTASFLSFIGPAANADRRAPMGDK